MSQFKLTEEQRVFSAIDKHLNHKSLNRELRCEHMEIADTSRTFTVPSGRYRLKLEKIKSA